MPDSRKMFRLAIASLLAAAFVAPAASAMPIDPTGPADATGPAQLDKRASTVDKPAGHQDLRAEGSIPSSRAAAQPSILKADLRSENAADPTRAPEPPIGMPAWPLDPKPITPAAPQPVAGDGDGGDFEWPIAALALMGALLLGGAVVVASRRLAQTRPAH